MMPRLKLASSAAHVSGRPARVGRGVHLARRALQTPLSSVKPAADWLFLRGVNHLVFHGIPYSPAGAPWPGLPVLRLRELRPRRRALARPARAQRLPHARAVDPAVGRARRRRAPLLLPPRRLVRPQAAVAAPRPRAAEPGSAGLRGDRACGCGDAATLGCRSGRRLADARVEDGRIRLGRGRYRALVLPRTRLMPRRRAPARGARARARRRDARRPARGRAGLGALAARRAELREALAGARGGAACSSVTTLEPLLAAAASRASRWRTRASSSCAAATRRAATTSS